MLDVFPTLAATLLDIFYMLDFHPPGHHVHYVDTQNNPKLSFFGRDVDQLGCLSDISLLCCIRVAGGRV